MGFLKTIADISIKRKPVKINQKDPTSNIVPKKDTCEALEKKAERKNTRTIPTPASMHRDLGKIIFPSKNRANPQKIIVDKSPKTKSSPLEISTGIVVKGRKKMGNSTMTKKSEKKEILSKILERMRTLYYGLILKSKHKKSHYNVDKPIFYVNYFSNFLTCCIP